MIWPENHIGLILGFIPVHKRSLMKIKCPVAQISSQQRSEAQKV